MIFESLQASFFVLFVYLCFPHILTLFNFIHVTFAEFHNFESVVYFAGVYTGYSLTVDTGFCEYLKNLLVIFQRPVPSRRALHRAILTGDRLIVMKSVQ